MSTDFVKQSLRENLGRVLIPHVADGLWSIYDSAKIASERNKQPEQTIKTFQNLLTRIPQWDEETLNKEVERISVASKCDYIEDLLLGVFVSYIRAFASLQQLDDTHVDIHFERPSVAKFVHVLYKSAARSSWSNAYLFKTIGVTAEQQARNRRDIETMISSSLNEVIDSFIPWKEISRAYFRAREAPAALVAPEPVPETAVPVVEALKEAPRPDTPAPKPVTFQDEHEVVEFETDDEEERPKLQLGEETTLDDLEEEEDEVDTDTELAEKAKETISLNL
jgi:hypothetical protein